MASRGLGQFPLCTNLAFMYEFDLSKIWQPGGMAYNKDFKSSLQPVVRVQNNLVEIMNR